MSDNKEIDSDFDEVIEMEALEAALSMKELKFCLHFLETDNGTKAAIHAGYSEKAARTQASRMLKKDYILDYLRACKRNLAKVSGVTQLRILKELERMAFSNASKFRDGWMHLKEFNDLTEDEKACISEITVTKVSRVNKKGTKTTEEIVKFKTYNKLSAIAEINKMTDGYSPQKVDHTTDGEKIVAPQLNYHIPPPEES